MEKRDGRMGADSPVPVLLITGPSGVGKTAVATEASELLDRARVAHALVDIDSLRWCYPRAPHDRFRVGLAMRNLAAVWANFRAAGATRLVLADVLESRDHLGRYRAAIPGADIVVVRLEATVGTLMLRVRRREVGSSLDRHLQHAAELATVMEHNRVEDILVQTDDKTVADVARDVLTRTNWLHGSKR